MERENLKEIWQKIKKSLAKKSKKIIVIGDAMLDRYIFCKANRISNEAPVIIFDKIREEYRLGGALNIAKSIKVLNNDCEVVFGIGEDEKSKIAKQMLKEEGIEYTTLNYKQKTTVKTRIVAKGQQLVRYDEKDKTKNNKKEELYKYLRKNIADSNIILISDHIEGMINKETFNIIEELAKKANKRLIVFSKRRLEEFNNVYLFKANRREDYEQFEKDPNRYIENIRKIMEKNNIKNVVINFDKGGLLLIGEWEYFIPRKRIDVSDVVALEDSIIVGLVVGINKGLKIIEAMELANIILKIKIRKFGTTGVSKEEIFEEIDSYK